MKSKEQEIVADIKRVAKELGLASGGVISKSLYLSRGRFSHYDLFDGGTTWSSHCQAAGFSPDIKNKPVGDEVYLIRVRGAFEKLGRLPKTSERKLFGLNFKKSRWANLTVFFEDARAKGYLPPMESSEAVITTVTKGVPAVINQKQEVGRTVPPIPVEAKRNKWERTSVAGFPYAPQDESGVIALFAILCASGRLPMQILSLNGGKGLDAVCWDEQGNREVVVELKFTLSKNSWNHHNQHLDYVVCWENRWKDFPQSVIELKTLLGRDTVGAK